MGAADTSAQSSQREQHSPPNPFVALFLFCVTHFVLVSALFLVVFHQVSASIANPPRGYWLTDYPQLWDIVFGTWRALSSPTYLLEVYGEWLGLKPRIWTDPMRALAQCVFCGCFWGGVSFSIYWLASLVWWRNSGQSTDQRPIPDTLGSSLSRA